MNWQEEFLKTYQNISIDVLFSEEDFKKHELERKERYKMIIEESKNIEVMDKDQERKFYE